MQRPPEHASIRLLIHGASGRMGRALLRLAAQREDVTVVGAVSRSQPAQRVVDGVPCFSAAELHGLPGFDACIDFSLPQGLAAIAATCEERGAALVSGTTGIGDDDAAALDRVATRIPVLWSSNFSLGVAVLGDLVERAAAALHGWDCDIVDSHHVHKKDAPSGTALTLGASAIAAGASPRYASIRAGDIVGEHLVQFTGHGERLELVHRATDRDVFAIGALYAAARLAGCAPGRYRLRDLILPAATGQARAD